jgi:hypothetical protein
VRNLKQTLKGLTWNNMVLAAMAFVIALMPVFAIVPKVGQAQLIDQFANNCPQGTGVRCNEGGLGQIFVTVINWALAIAFILAVLFLIFGGFRYILSGGNEESAKMGRQAIFNALIGIVIIVLSYVIVQIVYRFVSGTGGGGIFGT